MIKPYIRLLRSWGTQGNGQCLLSALSGALPAGARRARTHDKHLEVELGRDAHEQLHFFRSWRCVTNGRFALELWG